MIFGKPSAVLLAIGYGLWRYSLQKIGKTDVEKCIFYLTTIIPKTAEHILCNCGMLLCIWRKTLKGIILDSGKILHMSPKIEPKRWVVTKDLIREEATMGRATPFHTIP